jgi:hypothetical protein
MRLQHSSLRQSTLLLRYLRYAALAGSGVALPVAAQPVQPVPTVSAPVSELLASSPRITISNGLIKADVAPPGPRAFYRGTRFDQAGVITSLKLRGREFYGPWFDRTAPEVLDYAYDPNGAVVGGPDSATSGPAEEFAPLDFTPVPGLFVKIGVGGLRQPDTQPYDHYRHYEIVNSGKWTIKTSKTGIKLTQTLTNGETAYTYEKTLRLVPGKPELVIEHRLRNTGTKSITTTVYNHNFLKIAPGNAGVRVTFPFTIAAANPPPADLVHIQDRSLIYLRALTNKERVSFLVTGFGNTAADYNFDVADTVTGASVHVRGDKPVIRVNVFSIDKVQSVEPYIALDLLPGKEKHWIYVYSFKVP